MSVEERPRIQIVIGGNIQEIDSGFQRQPDLGVMSGCDVHDTSVLKIIV